MSANNSNVLNFVRKKHSGKLPSSPLKRHTDGGNSTKATAVDNSVLDLGRRSAKPISSATESRYGHHPDQSQLPVTMAERQRIAERSRVKTPLVKLEHSQDKSTSGPTQGHLQGGDSPSKVKDEISQDKPNIYPAFYETDGESINNTTMSFDVQVKDSQYQAQSHIPPRQQALATALPFDPPHRESHVRDIDVDADYDPDGRLSTEEYSHGYEDEQARVIDGWEERPEVVVDHDSFDERDESEFADSEDPSIAPDDTRSSSVTYSHTPGDVDAGEQSLFSYDPVNVPQDAWESYQHGPEQLTRFRAISTADNANPDLHVSAIQKGSHDILRVRSTGHVPKHSHAPRSDTVPVDESPAKGGKGMPVQSQPKRSTDRAHRQLGGDCYEGDQEGTALAGGTHIDEGQAMQLNDASVDRIHGSNQGQNIPNSKRGFELDYTEEQMAEMSYDKLKSEDFDHNPRPSANVLPEDLKSKSLKEKFDYICKLSDLPEEEQSERQKAFFESLSINDYEDCGDLVVEQLAELVKRMKEARRTRRKIAEEFEAEVAAREEYVRGEAAAIDGDLGRLKKAGGDVIRGRGS